jgi:HK97 family phage portal protein
LAAHRVTAAFDTRYHRTWSIDGEPVDLVFPSGVPGLSLPGLLIAPHMMLDDVPMPVGPVQAARRFLSGALDTDAYAADIIASGRGDQGAYLYTTSDITEATAGRWSDRWMTRRSDPASGIPVLGAGLELRSSLLNPADAQWLEGREFNAQEVARLFNVPPRYLGLPSGDASTYATARDNDVALFRYCIAGFTDPIADAWSSLLPPGRNTEEDVRVVFDPSGWLAPTDMERNEADAIAISSGIKTPDEVRAERAMPPLPAKPKEVTGVADAVA